MSKEMDNNNNNEFEIVSENDLEFASRGRKSKISDTEVQNVRIQVNKNPNGWVLFNAKAIPAGMVDAKEIRNHKATVSAQIRQLAKKLGMSVSIRWHKGTIPAAKFGKAKTK